MTGRAPGDRAALTYPCSWSFKVIGRDEGELRVAVAEIFQEREHEVALSRHSARGTYTSLNVTTLVLNEADRIDLLNALRSHERVILVL